MFSGKRFRWLSTDKHALGNNKTKYSVIEPVEAQIIHSIKFEYISCFFSWASPTTGKKGY